MYQPLAPCPACSRHVKTTEATCPFCRAALPDERGVMPGPPGRLSRAAAIAFTASLALTGCTTGTGTVADASADGPDDEGGLQPEYGAPAPVYGAPAFDAGPDDGGGPAPKYGGPPIDSGSD